MPLCNLHNKYYNDLEGVIGYNNWKKQVVRNFGDIVIKQDNNIDNARMDAGDSIKVACEVDFKTVDPNTAEVQAYFGQFMDNGVVKNVDVIPMTKISEDFEKNTAKYEATIKLTTGGNFGYTFRVLPKHEMLMDSENLNLIKWLEK